MEIYEKLSPEIPTFRLGIMGAPGTGKTMSALSFPGARLLTKDNKQPPGTLIVPFFDPVFEKSFSDKTSAGGVEITRSGPRSALINFLVKESTKRVGDKFTEVIDSWTAWMNDFEIWADKMAPVMFMTKGGRDKAPEVDGFAIHAERLGMCIEIMAATRAVQCNLIINIHEAVERNQDGVAIGVRPLSKGQFADQFAGHVTGFFRQKRIISKGANGDKAERYVWQVVADAEFPNPIRPPGMDLKRVELIDGKFIDANYVTLLKAMGKA